MRLELTKRTATRSPSMMIVSTSSRISGKARNSAPYVRVTSAPVRGLQKSEDVRRAFGAYNACKAATSCRLKESKSLSMMAPWALIIDIDIDRNSAEIVITRVSQRQKDIRY